MEVGSPNLCTGRAISIGDVEVARGASRASSSSLLKTRRGIQNLRSGCWVAGREGGRRAQPLILLLSVNRQLAFRAQHMNNNCCLVEECRPCGCTMLHDCMLGPWMEACASMHGQLFSVCFSVVLVRTALLYDLAVGRWHRLGRGG